LSGSGFMLYVTGSLVMEDGGDVVSWGICSAAGCANNQLAGEATNGILFAVATLRHSGSANLKVQLNFGMSFVSPSQASINLDATGVSTTSLDALAEQTANIWCSALSFVKSIVPVTGDDSLETLLYSAAYRTLMSPTVYSETGGAYMGLDKVVHNVQDDRQDAGLGPYSSARFSDLSLWDTFRSQHPWLLLTKTDVAVGVLRSIAEMTVEQNAFPKWVLGNHESGCMIGLHGGALVLEAVLSGLADTFNVTVLQSALLKQATESVPVNGRADVEHYLAAGYVSQEASDAASSLTVSYAYDDFILAGVSDFVGDTASADAANLRSKNYKNIWVSRKQYICPKYANGDVDCPSDPTGLLSWQYYKEGDALHWSYFAPHDVAGLIALFPSPAAFEAALDTYFEEHVAYNEKLGSAVPNPYYWAGNEHNMFTPWMFSFNTETANCTKTHFWSRYLTNHHFSAKPNGLPGNDDYGSMSSLLLFASLGFFPQAGTTNFVISSPRVQSATLVLDKLYNLPEGVSSELKIVTYDNSDVNVYVSRLVVDGVEHSSPFIDRSQLAKKGGTLLEYYMSSTPASSLCAKKS